MKNIVALMISFLFLCSVKGVSAHSGSHEDAASFTKHFHESLFMISERGQVSFEVLLDEKEYKIGKGMIGIVVHDSHDEDVEDAKLEVTVTGNAEPLKVIDKGGGLYLVPGTGLPKDGPGELRITVKKKKIQDSAAFVFPDVLNNKLPAGKYDARSAKPPSR